MGKNTNALVSGIAAVDPALKHVLEFGVYRGHTMRIIRDSFDESYQVFGFDSFEGLPHDWDRAGVKKKDFDTGGKIPDIEGVTFFKGWFSRTVSQYRETAKPIGLIHMDCDLYLSTKFALFGLNDFIVKGTIIVFDEWIYNHDPQFNDEEQAAFWDWSVRRGGEFEFPDFPGCEEITCEQKIVRIL